VITNRKKTREAKHITCVSALHNRGGDGAPTIVSGQLKCDGTHAETRFHLSAKWMRIFKSAGASVQLTTGSRGVHISGSNAGYTMFRGSVKGTGYPLHSPVYRPLPPPRASPCAITFQLQSTRLQAAKYRVRHPAGVRVRPLLQTVQTGSGAHPTQFFWWE